MALAGTVPANAEQASVAPAASTTTAMQFVPMTRENASWAGYEVRTNPDGTLYGVPIGTPEGSHSEEVKVAQTTGVQPRGTITGNCGSSTVKFLSKTKVNTSYTIFSKFGSPISHTWTLTYSSSIDLVAQDLSGLAPWGSQTWTTNATVIGQALNGTRLTVMASGNVLTTNGYCSSGNPYDVYQF